MPRLFTELDSADDLYLDSISHLLMTSWTRGRAGLVGDAGYAPGAVVGGGTILAVIGAFVLASELVAAGGDTSVASPRTNRRSGPWCSAAGPSERVPST